eukprot:gene26376-35014_t
MYFVTISVFLWALVVNMLLPWLLSLKARNLKESPITINEMSCMWYSVSTLILKFIVPGIFLLPIGLQWSQSTTLQVHAFVYSLALLGAIICNVPGRLARSAVDSERRRLVDAKRNIIRYLSHEVRSPLNIIASAIGFMEMDMAALPPSPAKATVLESLLTVRQASQDILHTMNEMLQMETINSGSLSLDSTMVPCGELMEIVQRSGVAAREKDVQFFVQEFLTREHGIGIEHLGCRDLESGSIIEEVIELPRLEDIALFVDKFKIGQVLRNLVTNAVKFTPPGESVTVNIRAATAAEEAVIAEDSRKALRDNRHAALTSNTAAAAAGRAPNGNNIDGGGDGSSGSRNGNDLTSYRSAGHAVIEVVDTGAGISPADHSKVFGAFAQFRANELQGGGGTGLGLWISQEIAKKHGSVIHFRSEGLGKGTTFYFAVGLYIRNRQKSMQASSSPPRTPTAWQEQRHHRNRKSPKYNLTQPRIAPEMSHSSLEIVVPHEISALTASDNFFGSTDAVAVADGVTTVSISGNDEKKKNKVLALKVLAVDDSKANLKFLVRHITQAAAQCADHIMSKPITTAEVGGMIQKMITRLDNEEESKRGEMLV